MSYLLLVDTAIQGVAVGLTPLKGAAAGDVVWSQIVDAVNDSARLLPLAVDSGLKECGIQPGDVSGIVVTTGPGSFTGLRVGLAYAMGFAAGIEALRGLPTCWLGLSSLVEIAKDCAVHDPRETFLVALAATKTAGYACHLAANNEAQLVPIQVIDGFSHLNVTRLVIVGEWALLDEKWQALSSSHKNIKKISYVEASSLVLKRYAAIGFNSWPAGFAESMPSPNYLRKSTVEEKEKEKDREKNEYRKN